MTRSTKLGVFKYHWLILLAIAPLLLTGCGSSARSDSAESPGGGSDAHLDVGCMLEHVEKPTESFHFSFKYADDSSWVNKEADVSTQAMDITTKDASGSHSYHAVRSDEQSWGSALLVLSSLNFTGLTGRLAGIEGTSAVSSQGVAQVNGYKATKYTVDTTAANSQDRQVFATLFGAGSFDKGVIWMGPDGCAVNAVVDEGLLIDNKIVKRHFEISRSAKQ